MDITLGMPKFPDRSTGACDPIVWRASEVINGHMIVVGTSGSGKTHLVRSVIRSMAGGQPPVRIVVLDAHGDLGVSDESVTTIHETGDVGLNPLELNPDPINGGIRRQIRTFIDMIRRSSSALGAKQEAVLGYLLTDLYAEKGFYADQPASWRLTDQTFPDGQKAYPTVADLRELTKRKLEQLVTGAGGAAHASLEQLQRHYRELQRAVIQENVDHETLVKLKIRARDDFAEYIDAIQSGDELNDCIRYHSRDVLQSVFDRINILESSGIFKSRPPALDQKARVWRFSIKALRLEEQRMFVEMVLEKFFQRARDLGEQPGLRWVFVVDEAHLFMNDERDYILTRLFMEGRKFGIGVILATQNISHFSEDIITNAATKVVLHLDEMLYDAVSRKLQIDKKRFRFVKARSDAIVQVKGTAEHSTNRFVDVVLGG